MSKYPWALSWHDGQTVSFEVERVDDMGCVYIPEMDATFETEIQAWESAEETLLQLRANINASLRKARTGKRKATQP